MTTATINGEARELGATAGRTLIAYLRDELGLTGTKPGCGEGECGSCTVLVDGTPALACQTSLADVADRSVTTIEGLAGDAGLHPVQQALIEERASQCGYCTPGMALRAAALLTHDPDPDDERIAAALDPNLCRCGCYVRIVRAVHHAAELVRDSGGKALPAATLLDQPELARPRIPWISPSRGTGNGSTCSATGSSSCGRRRHRRPGCGRRGAAPGCTSRPRAS